MFFFVIEVVHIPFILNINIISVIGLLMNT